LRNLRIYRILKIPVLTKVVTVICHHTKNCKLLITKCLYLFTGVQHLSGWE
jgi:hypothetical protein